MKRIITIVMLLTGTMLATCSCGKQNTEQEQEEQKKDALVGTVWKTEIVTPTRYLHFLEDGRARITFSDSKKAFEGTYTIRDNNISFDIAWELLAHSNYITISYIYKFNTGVIEGNKITIHGNILSATEYSGQEFIDFYYKMENE